VAPEPPPGSGETEHELVSTGVRIERALDDLRRTAPPDVTARVEHLVSDIVGLYGEALARIVAALSTQSLEGARAALVGDPLVSALLVLHELHPNDTRSRIETALDSVRPYLASHGGSISTEALDDDGTLRLRFAGNCNGCTASADTAKNLVERAVRDAAPEVLRVVIEDSEAAVPHPPPATSSGLVQLGRPRGSETQRKGGAP
jgi:Fe-S cluster biogenesis protein NfuA